MMSADDVGADDAALRAAAQARLAKHGVTLDEDNVQLVIRHIADYPEIVAAALAAVPRPVTQPEGDVHEACHEAADVLASQRNSAIRHGRVPAPDDEHTSDGRCKYPTTCVTTSSQPAHGEATGGLECDSCSHRGPRDPRSGECGSCGGRSFSPWGDQIDPPLPPPAHGDNEAALRVNVRAISTLISGSYPADLDPEAHRWRRVMKVAEEVGEVTEAILGLSGENPRKGITHTLDDLRKELLDVALAALGAVSHLDGDTNDTAALLDLHAAFVADRLRAALSASAEPEGGEGR